VKERAPKSLDEALSVALRLEAWEKSVGHPRQNEDRSDRPRQKARAAGKSETAKESQDPKPDPQVAELKAEVTRLSKELKRLSEKPIPPTETTDTRGTPARNPPSVRVQGTEATASAGESPRPLMAQGGGYQRPVQNRAFLPSQPPVCWGCGLPGHIKRNCPSNKPGSFGPLPINLANRGSKNFQDNSHVYIMMKLMGKDVPCFVDSGCDITSVPKTLTDRYKSLEVIPSDRHIWAANNTPTRIEGELSYLVVRRTMPMDPSANLRGRRRGHVGHRLA